MKAAVRRDILVGNADLLLQGVQLRIVEYLPPFAVERGVGGLRDFPAERLRSFGSELLVSGRSGNRRSLVFWSNGATAQTAS